MVCKIQFQSKAFQKEHLTPRGSFVCENSTSEQRFSERKPHTLRQLLFAKFQLRTELLRTRTTLFAKYRQHTSLQEGSTDLARAPCVEGVKWKGEKRMRVDFCGGSFSKLRINWSRGVTVSTLDSESSDRGSNPRGTFSSRCEDSRRALAPLQR